MPPPTARGPLCTRGSLAEDLRRLGVADGDTLLLHSSLSSLGWVNGGGATVISALLDVLGPGGTLVVPTHNLANSDPAEWTAPAVPEEWWQTIRDTMPPYDARTTPTRAMGVIPELLRSWPGAARSGHPQTSFTAVGARAGRITAGHDLDCRLGERSPLARLDELDDGPPARVLLLGVGFDVCTAFHLGEYRMPRVARGNNSFAAAVDGPRAWLTVRDVPINGDDFGELGRDLERQSGAVVAGRVGAAECRLFSLPEAVRFATDWLTTHRQGGGKLE
ncbi:hypothetical protein CDD83_10537 [Cordyceps sp. RAO-2017]|nr:hypothetical protein CDD83_10537 [Cordyceps sp. RAO-2017]